jgi:hypothetical protein
MRWLLKIFVQGSLTAFLFALLSCNLWTVNGNQGSSDNIADSKKRGVFICQYIPPRNPYKVNDSITINVKEAWLEHDFIYDGFFSEKAIKLNEGYRLVINTDEKSIKGFENSNWSIGNSYTKVFTSISNSETSGLHTDFNEPLDKDTITWEVQQGSELHEERPKKIIGKFELIRKCK